MSQNLTPGRLAKILALVEKLEEECVLNQLLRKKEEEVDHVIDLISILLRAKDARSISIESIKGLVGIKDTVPDIFDDPGAGS